MNNLDQDFGRGGDGALLGLGGLGAGSAQQKVGAGLAAEGFGGGVLLLAAGRLLELLVRLCG